MEIVKGKSAELATVMAMVADVLQDMNTRGIDQWHDGYPNEAVIANDLANGWLHILKVEGKMAGTIVLNTQGDPEYNAMSWLTEPGTSLYVHRLAIHPKYQRKGLGTTLMAFAEAQASTLGYDSVRLDTYTGNPGNIKLYEGLGYTTIGTLHLPYRPKPFVCYERLVPA